MMGSRPWCTPFVGAPTAICHLGLSSFKQPHTTPGRPSSVHLTPRKLSGHQKKIQQGSPSFGQISHGWGTPLGGNNCRSFWSDYRWVICCYSALSGPGLSRWTYQGCRHCPHCNQGASLVNPQLRNVLHFPAPRNPRPMPLQSSTTRGGG